MSYIITIVNCAEGAVVYQTFTHNEDGDKENFVSNKYLRTELSTLEALETAAITACSASSYISMLFKASASRCLTDEGLTRVTDGSFCATEVAALLAELEAK